MAERASAFVAASRALGLSERRGWSLIQYHAWPERYARVAEKARMQCGASSSPSPGKAVNGTQGALLRIHPQRLWLLASRENAVAETLAAEDGVTLDLSHARTIISVEAGIAEALLSRFVAIDLRGAHFAVDDVAATSLHRVPVVLWRRADGIDILAPRSFARAIWDALAEIAGRL